MKAVSFIFLILFSVCTLQGSMLLDIGHHNARLFGTAGSMLLETADINNLEVFPASLAGIKENEVSAGFLNWADLVNMFRLSIAKQIGPSDVLAASVCFAGFKDMVNLDETGTDLGLLRNSDYGINVGYGLSLLRNFQAGANIRFVNMSVNDSTGRWLGFGISAMVGLKVPGLPVLSKENLTVGAGAQDISIVSPDMAGSSSGYPVHVNAGFIYDTARFGRLSVRLGMDLEYLTVYKQQFLSGGIELDWNRFIIFRAGSSFMAEEFDRLNFGFGIRRQITETGVVMKFDYGIGLAEDIQNHFIQLGTAF